MKQLVEDIAKALVDIPETVSVRVVEGELAMVLELKVAASDLGKVIGRQGRTVRAIRTILNAAGMKLNRRFTLVILALAEAEAPIARMGLSAIGAGIPYSQNRRNGCTDRWMECPLLSGFWLRVTRRLDATCDVKINPLKRWAHQN